MFFYYLKRHLWNKYEVIVKFKDKLWRFKNQQRFIINTSVAGMLKNVFMITILIFQNILFITALKKDNRRCWRIKKRLDNFDKKIIQPQVSNQNITDQDMIFLKKEISRNSSSLSSTKALTQEIADDSVKIRDQQI